MVCEHAHFLHMVHKSLVNGSVDRGESYVVAPVGEYGFEAVKLLVAVAQNVKRVAVGKHFFERLADEVEIFVVYRLGRASEVDRHSAQAIFRRRCCSEAKLPECREFCGECLGVHDIAHCVGVAFVGNKRAVAERFSRYRGYAAQGVVGVSDRENCLRADEVKQRFAGCSVCHIGCHRYFFEFLFRQLCGCVEHPYGVYLIAEEIYSEGEFVAVAVYVENRASVCEMSGLIHIVHLCEAVQA